MRDLMLSDKDAPELINASDFEYSYDSDYNDELDGGSAPKVPFQGVSLSEGIHLDGWVRTNETEFSDDS